MPMILRLLKRIFKAKGRPLDNPLIVHIAKVSQLNPLVRRSLLRLRL